MILYLDGDYDCPGEDTLFFDSIREHTKKEEFISVRIDNSMDWEKLYRYLEDASAIVLAAAVRMDSVPPRVLSFLEKVEQKVIEGESIGAKFYAILHTDLYEGEQTGIAMGVLKNFCVRANITWGRGLGIGGNGIKVSEGSAGLRGLFRKNKADFRLKPLYEQALFIREKMQGPDVYINPKEVSRNSYMRRMNHNGKRKQLYASYEP